MVRVQSHRKRSPFTVLGVKPGDSRDQIKEAYRRLLKKWHPDVNKRPGAEEKTKDINAAYEELIEKSTVPTLSAAERDEIERNHTWRGSRATRTQVQQMEMTALIMKLDPRRFSGMSPQMAAIIGYLLGKKWTVPTLVSLYITSDGLVMGRNSDGREIFIGSNKDLANNISSLIAAAELTPEENEAFGILYNEKVGVWYAYR